MHSSAIEDKDNAEVTHIRSLVELSLQANSEPVQNFNSINSINVPVNQEVAWELTRFKSKNRVYKNPNLSDIHSKSALDKSPPPTRKYRDKPETPPPALKTHQSKVANRRRARAGSGDGGIG